MINFVKKRHCCSPNGSGDLFWEVLVGDLDLVNFYLFIKVVASRRRCCGIHNLIQTTSIMLGISFSKQFVNSRHHKQTPTLALLYGKAAMKAPRTFQE